MCNTSRQVQLETATTQQRQAGTGKGLDRVQPAGRASENRWKACGRLRARPTGRNKAAGMGRSARHNETWASACHADKVAPGTARRQSHTQQVSTGKQPPTQLKHNERRLSSPLVPHLLSHLLLLGGELQHLEGAGVGGGRAGAWAQDGQAGVDTSEAHTSIHDLPPTGREALPCVFGARYTD